MPYTEHQDSTGWSVAFGWFGMTNRRYEEMFVWLSKNTKGLYWRDPVYCDSLQFSREEDAIAFKLVWGAVDPEPRPKKI